MHGLRFCAMGRRNFVGVGGLLVLCMGSDSLLWTEVILLWLVVFLCSAWAQILCYEQKLFCCGWWFSCAMRGLRLCALGRRNLVGVGGLLVLCMCLDSLLLTEVILLWLVVCLC